MQRPRRIARFWDSLRHSWRVPSRRGRQQELAGRLYLRELEERRVLSVTTSTVIISPVALMGMAEGAALSLDPGEATGNELSHADSNSQDNPSTPAVHGQQPGEPPGQQASSDAGNSSDHLPAENATPLADPLAVNVEADGLTLTVASDRSADEAATLTLVDIGQFSDESILATEYAFSIDWGDGTTTDVGVATIDMPGGDGTPTLGSFDGSHTYADNGDYIVTVTLTRDNEVSVSDTFAITVDNVTPELSVVGDQSIDEGAPLVIENIGQFTDPGFDNPLNAEGETTERFSYAIDWGDGTDVDSGPATIDVPGAAGVETRGSFDGSHTYADNGTYLVTVTISDDDGGTVSDTFTVTVNNVAPELTVVGDQSIDEGAPLVIPNIGEFTDPGFDNPLNSEGETTERFTYSIDWGDGTDADFGPATIDVPGGPGALTRGSFDGSHIYADNGEYTVTVTISDDDGGTTSASFLVTVNNVAPTLIVPEDQSIDEGQTLSLTDIGVFTDPGFDNPKNLEGEVTERFTYAIDWGDGSEIDSGPAIIDVPGAPGELTRGSFDGSHVFADNGTYLVTVTISDDDGGTTSDTFLVTVDNVAPELTVPDDQVIDEGATLALVDIGVFTDPGFDNPLDPDGPTSESFTYSIDWGDGTPADEDSPTIDTMGSPDVPTTGSFDGSHVYADNGEYTVTVTITDDDGGSTSETFLVTVNNVTPTLEVPPDQTIDDGETLTLIDIGVFTDPGFDNPLNVDGETTERFTFAIDWGDGSEIDSGPGTIDTPGSPGVPTSGSFDGSHLYAAPGTYTVTVTISDDDGGTVSDTFLVTVVPSALVVTPAQDQVTDEGAALTVIDIGQFTSGNTDGTFTYSIDWGDGTSADAGVPSIDGPGPQGFGIAGSFDGTHIYADNGEYLVTVTVIDSERGSTSAQLTVTVENVAPSLVVPVDQTIGRGVPLVLSDIGQFADPGFDNPLNLGGQTTERFTYTINWGDGSTSEFGPAPIDAPGGPGVQTAGSFAGEHVYASGGIYTVTVTVSDDDGGVASDTFLVYVGPTLTVTDGEHVVDEGTPLVISGIGQYIDPTPLDVRPEGSEAETPYTFTINWGDGTATDAGSASVAAGGLPGVAFSGSFDGAHVYADNGLYTLTISITSPDGRVDTQTLLVTVNNVAPTLIVVGNQTIGQTEPMALPSIGQFNDPGFDNLLNVGGETTERFTFTINWGDGTPTDSGAGGINVPGQPGLLTAGDFDGGHTYFASGTFTVTVTVSDDDGGSSSGTFEVTVGQVNTQNVMFLPPGGGGRAPAERPVNLQAATRQPAPTAAARTEIGRYRSASVAGAEPQLVLRVVLPSGQEEVELLPDDALDNLQKLFSRLPDGHYRVYEIQPDGIERLVVDVIVRQGRSIDAADEAEDFGDLPPAEPAGDAAPPEASLPDEQPEAALPLPAPQAPLTEQTPGEADAEAARPGPRAAMIAAGGGVVVASASSRRAARIAREPLEPEARRLTKAIRRLRRLR